MKYIKILYVIVAITVIKIVTEKYGIPGFWSSLLGAILGYFIIPKGFRIIQRRIQKARYDKEIEGIINRKDNLFLAAEAGRSAKKAVKEKQFDIAWKKFHEQKTHYMEHANASGFTPKQIIALDSSVHVDLANVLRLEGKHRDALVNLIYAYAGDGKDINDTQAKKLKAYFNRCKYETATMKEVSYLLFQALKQPDIRLIQKSIGEWD